MTTRHFHITDKLICLRFLERGEAIRYKSYYKNEYQNGLSKVREELAKSICAEVAMLKNEEDKSANDKDKSDQQTSPNVIKIKKKTSPQLSGSTSVLKVSLELKCFYFHNPYKHKRNKKK